MPSENIPTQDAQLSIWLTTFANVAVAEPAELGLTPAQAEAMELAAVEFKESLARVLVAKNAFRKAIEAKRTARQTALDLFRAYGKSILTDPDVDMDMKTKVGMKVDKPSPKPLVPAEQLSSVAHGNGTNILKWDRAGNSKHVSFIIEAQIGASTAWITVGHTSRVTFTDRNRIPGQRVIYRVIAFRGTKKSPPSNLTIVYADQPLATLGLQEAA